MKKGAKRSLVILGSLFGLYVLKTAGVFTSLATFPWWTYFIIAGILFSGYRFLVESQKDKNADKEWIEEQGEVYMKRIDAERKKRRA